MLNCQSLFSALKEAGGRLFSLVVACWTANHCFLGRKSLREAVYSSGSMLNCQSLFSGLKEAGGRLFSLVVA